MKPHAHQPSPCGLLQPEAWAPPPPVPAPTFPSCKGDKEAHGVPAQPLLAGLSWVPGLCLFLHLQNGVGSTVYLTGLL